MRIGELLLESALINAKELGDALYYMRAKALPLGRCLKILRAISEEDLAKALEAQKLIRKGLEPALAVEVLKDCCKRNVAFHEALSQKSKTAQGLGSALEASNITGSSAGVPAAPGFRRFTNEFPTISKMVLVEENAQKVEAPRAKQSPTELISEADQWLLDDRCLDAEKNYLEAREGLIASYGPAHENTAPCLIKLANLYLALDRFTEAEPLYQTVLEIYKRNKGPEDPLVAKALEDLGDLFVARAKFAEAQTYFESSLTLVDKQAQPDMQIAGRLLNKLSTAIRGVEDPASLQTKRNSPLAASTRPVGIALISPASNPAPGTPATAPDARKKIGEFCTDAGILTPEKLQQALQRSKQAGKPLGSVLKDERFLTAQQLESTLFAQLLTKEELVPYKVAVKALSLASKAKMPLRELAESGRLVSEVKASDSQYREMVLEHEQLIAAENSKGPEHPDVAAIALRLADLHVARHDNQTALMLLRRAYGITQKQAGVDPLLLSITAEKLAAILINDSKFLEAQPFLMKALELRQSKGSGNNAEAINGLTLLAKVEASQHNFPSALSFYRSALALHDKLMPDKCPPEIIQGYVDCCIEVGMNAEAETAYQRVVTWAQSAFGPFEPETAAYVEKLGDIYAMSSQQQKAEAQYYFALQIYDRALECATQSASLQMKLAKLRSTA